MAGVSIYRVIDNAPDGIAYAKYPDGDTTQSWQLASGHWVPRKFDMVIAHPRPDSETTTAEQNRNAYTGLAWDTRVLVYGGAYPFHFELVTAPSGMTIGGDLVVSGDVLVEPANYGKLEWSNPTAGNHTVTVRVYDQDYNRGSPSAYVEVSFELTVGTSNWLFIDPVSGSNGAAGTLAAPWADTTNLISGSTYAGKCVMIRTGTMNLVGMAASNYVFDGNQPGVFVGYPGETAVINMDAGGFIGQDPGFCLRNLTLQHDAVGYGNSQKILLLNTTDAHRAQITDCIVPNYNIGTASSGNGGVFVSLAGATINYPCLAYNEFTGNQGPGWHTYETQYGVIHGNDWHDITLNGFDGSTQGVIFFKSSAYSMSVRKNEIWDTLAGTGENRLMGFKSNIHNGEAYGLQNIEFCYNTFYRTGYAGREATWREGDNNAADGPIDNYHFYRNSFGDSNNVECQGSAVLTNSTRQYNAFTGSFETHAEINDSNNLESAAYFDTATLKLTGASRTSYLGTHGAEVA